MVYIHVYTYLLQEMEHLIFGMMYLEFSHKTCLDLCLYSLKNIISIEHKFQKRETLDPVEMLLKFIFE